MTSRFVLVKYPLALFVSLLLCKSCAVLLSDGDVRPILSYARQLSTSDTLRSLRYYQDVIEGAESAHFAAEALYESSQLQTQNASRHFLYLSRAAALGHDTAQSELASVYNTGVASSALAPVHAGRGLLLHYFAALAGDHAANMAIGYRLMFGEGLKYNCEKAIVHYELVANAVAHQIEKRGFALYFDSHRYSDSSWSNSHTKHAHKEITQESIDYFEHMSSEGDLGATVNLANIYLHGSRYIPMDLPLAVKYLRRAADAGAHSAQGQLGYLYIRGGMGIERDPQMGLKYLRLSMSRSDTLGHLGLGFAHWQGIGVEANVSKAMEHFEKIMTKHADAAYFMAEMIMGSARHSEAPPVTPIDEAAYGTQEEQQQNNRKRKRKLSDVDYMRAAQLYSAASMRGSLLALHRLSYMILYGKGTQQSCHSALHGFKSLAERSDFVALSIRKAHSLYSAGDYLAALRLFSLLADRGVEVAQANAAFILSKSFMCPSLMSYPGDPMQDISMSSSSSCSTDKQWPDVSLAVSADDYSAIPESSVAKMIPCEVRALSFYRQSGSQGNGEGYLKMGDHVYYGKGGVAANKEEAVEYYQMAADMRHSHAMFNLGLMYEAGDGVPQDFHLAKRYFDEAATADNDAKLLGYIAVMLLQSHRHLQTIIGKPAIDSLSGAASSAAIYVNSVLRPLSSAFSSYIPKFDRTQAMLTRQENVVHWLQYYAFRWPALKLVMTVGGGMRRSIEKVANGITKLKRSPLEQNIRIAGDDTVHEMTILVGLMTVFVFVLFLRRARRQQRQ